MQIDPSSVPFTATERNANIRPLYARSTLLRAAGEEREQLGP